MKRLSETDRTELDANEHGLAELFRAAAPFEKDPFRKRRVLVGLSRRQVGTRTRFWIRPVAIATLLVSGSAAAAIGHRYVSHGGSFFGWGAPNTAASGAVGGAKSQTQVALTPTVTTAPEADTPSADPAVTNGDPTTIDSVNPTGNSAAPLRTLPKSSHSHSSSSSSSSEDATHIVEAIQALRTDKDPSRAQSLLNDYMQTHPNGVLSEDALALSIEAASAKHDPKAADYARRYLAKFPHGKYRSLASQALGQNGR